jgi:hypothetical protein
MNHNQLSLLVDTDQLLLQLEVATRGVFGVREARFSLIQLLL